MLACPPLQISLANSYIPPQNLQRRGGCTHMLATLPIPRTHQSTHLTRAVLPASASPTTQILIFLSGPEEPDAERSFSEPGTHEKELSRLNTSRVPTDPAGVPGRLEARLLLMLLKLIFDKPRLRVLVSLLRLEAGRSNVSAFESCGQALAYTSSTLGR